MGMLPRPKPLPATVTKPGTAPEGSLDSSSRESEVTDPTNTLAVTCRAFCRWGVSRAISPGPKDETCNEARLPPRSPADAALAMPVRPLRLWPLPARLPCRHLSTGPDQALVLHLARAAIVSRLACGGCLLF
uniref:Uncharacterized protein n=1 Tax=Molossus molossus TaxID=27622 RepID=A0A7J8JWI2_MOLMO|nr:hypothetical protein HJG59_007778 [Molossus molossus]